MYIGQPFNFEPKINRKTVKDIVISSVFALKILCYGFILSTLSSGKHFREIVV